MVIAEVKRETKQPDLNQAEWLKELLMVSEVAGEWVVAVEVWRPSSWERIERLLA